MRYRGENKIYFEIGIRPDQRQLHAIEIYFSWFKLIKKNDAGGMLQRGVNYKGIYWYKTFHFPEVGYEYKKKEPEKHFFDVMKARRENLLKILDNRIKRSKIMFIRKDK